MNMDETLLMAPSVALTACAYTYDDVHVTVNPYQEYGWMISTVVWLFILADCPQQLLTPTYWLTLAVFRSQRALWIVDRMGGKQKRDRQNK